MEPARAEIQEKIDELVADPQISKPQYKELVREWLVEQEVSELETERILNDLNSYEGYL